MKVLVVSGFLGAGKTTFITRMAQTCAEKFVVMENEMGAVGVDGGILSSSVPSGVKVWELTEGCICCSMKTDFATSVLTIESALQPDLLLVEPTGVGMLSRIIENIRGIEYDRIELMSPITILDARACARLSRDFPDIFDDQLANAGTVVLSKIDLAAPDELAAAVDLVRAVTDTADVISTPYSEQPAEWWSSLWRRKLSGEVVPVSDGAELGLESVGFASARCETPGRLAAFLEDLIRGAFGNIIRAKGFLDVGRERLRFDVVSGAYSITETSASDEARCVFIGRGIDADALRAALRSASAEHDHEHSEHEHHRE